MKVTFVSNYINHHQIPVSSELYAKLGADYAFVQTEAMEPERVQMGWNPDTESLPYLRLYEKDPQGIMQLIMDSDMVIFGGTDDESFIQPRLKSGKPVIRYSERIYKTGQWKFISPRGLKKKYEDHTQYRKAPVYMLCAGAYVASDFNLVRAYPNKKLKWGYFPAMKDYDVDKLLDEKAGKTGRMEILWAARFIDWKHPEMVVKLAETLKKENYNFHITMIGGGVMKDEIEQMVEALGVGDFVTLAGFRTPDEVRTYMERADIYLVTSDRQEGWGAVVNEAMNSGCAVVGDAMIGAVPYLIENGVNGLIYKTRNQKALEQAVKVLLDEPGQTRELGRRAYQTIQETWNAKVAAERLLVFAEELLSGEPNLERYSEGPLSRA
ncbi:MAG: glycosyltransferase family 4 protein [Lachnospiraceae bacterium]|nr:glycosyltransferase family 4 protein [Lachnospiraceae bacterium]